MRSLDECDRMSSGNKETAIQAHTQKNDVNATLGAVRPRERQPGLKQLRHFLDEWLEEGVDHKRRLLWSRYETKREAQMPPNGVAYSELGQTPRGSKPEYLGDIDDVREKSADAVRPEKKGNVNDKHAKYRITFCEKV